MGSIPLPYSSAPPYPSLFPSQEGKWVYSDSIVPNCGRCDGKRVFECQLMPHLISLLPTITIPPIPVPEEETKEEKAKRIKADLHNAGGMEWGTILIFSCVKDCMVGEEREAWAEEECIVQWDE